MTPTPQPTQTGSAASRHRVASRAQHTAAAATARRQHAARSLADRSDRPVPGHPVFLPRPHSGRGELLRAASAGERAEASAAVALHARPGPVGHSVVKLPVGAGIAGKWAANERSCPARFHGAVEAALKVLYLVATTRRKNRTDLIGKTNGWKAILNTLTVHYGDRIADHIR